MTNRLHRCYEKDPLEVDHALRAKLTKLSGILFNAGLPLPAIAQIIIDIRNLHRDYANLLGPETVEQLIMSDAQELNARFLGAGADGIVAFYKESVLLTKTHPTPKFLNNFSTN